jgi:hypothetical protein
LGINKIIKMSKLITISIDVTSIPRDKIKPHTNGKSYVAMDVWVNDDVDKFGKDVSVNISQSKEERETRTKKVYVGGGNTKFGFGDSASNKAPANNSATNDDFDEIPF